MLKHVITSSLITSRLCANLTYFGLTLNIQSFAGSIYVNLAIAGALEFVGSLFGQLIINTRFGRRIPASALYFLSGLSLLLIIAVPSGKQENLFCYAQFCFYVRPCNVGIQNPAISTHALIPLSDYCCPKNG